MWQEHKKTKGDKNKSSLRSTAEEEPKQSMLSAEAAVTVQLQTCRHQQPCGYQQMYGH